MAWFENYRVLKVYLSELKEKIGVFENSCQILILFFLILRLPPGSRFGGEIS